MQKFQEIVSISSVIHRKIEPSLQIKLRSRIWFRAQNSGAPLCSAYHNILFGLTPDRGWLEGMFPVRQSCFRWGREVPRVHTAAAVRIILFELSRARGAEEPVITNQNTGSCRARARRKLRRIRATGWREWCRIYIQLWAQENFIYLAEIIFSGWTPPMKQDD